MHEVIIDPKELEKRYWKDIWQYKDLFAFFAWRDILVRYKQTVVGVAWAVLRPLMTMLILTFVFSYLAKMPSHGSPYPIYVFCGLLPWQFFSTSFMSSSNSLVQAAAMLTKVYFPRLVVPTSAVITSLVDFFISCVIMVCVMAYYQYMPSGRIVYLPLFTLITFMFSLGAGLWISALMVRYRDFKIIVPFVIQFGLYVTPVGFSSSVVPEKFQILYALNPMVGVIDGFRWAILGGDSLLSATSIVISVVISIITLLTGVFYFRKMEKTFADYI